jgi:D-arabinose 1-dehydrogenase-like Zn-dependent alcohol dehydrogenase
MLPGGTIYPLTVDFGKTPVTMLKLLVSGLSIQGSAIASRREIRRMLKFCVQHDIKPTIMTWPMNQKGVEEALKTLNEGKMRYRGVLVAE